MAASSRFPVNSRGIQAGADVKKEKRRKKRGDAANSRNEVPALGVVGEHQSGKKRAHDGRHSDLRRQPGKKQTNGQRDDQRRIPRGHAIHLRMNAMNNMRRDEHHEQREGYRLHAQHAQMQPLHARARGRSGNDRQHHHANDVVKHRSGQNNLRGASGQQIHIAQYARGDSNTRRHHGRSHEDRLEVGVSPQLHVSEAEHKWRHDSRNAKPLAPYG